MPQQPWLKIEPLDRGWDAGVPAASVCLGSPCSVPLLRRALAWAKHSLAEELNCAVAVLHRNIWLKAYRKISEEEFCNSNTNLILHEVKSIFEHLPRVSKPYVFQFHLVWDICFHSFPSLQLVLGRSCIFQSCVSGLQYMDFAPTHCPYKTLGRWISAQ